MDYLCKKIKHMEMQEIENNQKSPPPEYKNGELDKKLKALRLILLPEDTKVIAEKVGVTTQTVNQYLRGCATGKYSTKYKILEAGLAIVQERELQLRNFDI